MSIYYRRSYGMAMGAVLWMLIALTTTGIGVVTWQFLTTPPADSTGTIELSDLMLERNDTHMELQLDARVRLSPTMQAGLDNGVPLTFLLDLEIVQPRRFWLNKSVMLFERQYTLTYYELTRHYRVSALKSDTNRNFRSLSSALQGLGEMVQVSVELDAGQLAQFERDGLLASVNMQLSQSALPLPLQPIIRSSWRLMSGEYQWPIT